MKIRQAIEEARKINSRISSPSIGMYGQDANSLVFWLFTNDYNQTDSKSKVQLSVNKSS